MIHWWTEPAASQRTSAWYDRIADTLARGGRYVALSPAHWQATVTQLLTPERPALLGTQCTTLTQWALQTAPPPRPALHDAARLAILWEQLPQCALRHYGEALEHYSTARVLMRGVGSCLRAGLTPDDIRTAAQQSGSAAEADLARVLDAYQRASAAHGIDPATHIATAVAQWTPDISSPWVLDIGLAPHPVLPHLLERLAAAGATVHCAAPTTSFVTAQSPLAAQPTDEILVTHADAIHTHRAADPIAQYRAVAHQARAALEAGIAPQHLGIVCCDPRGAALLARELGAVGLLSAGPELPLAATHWARLLAAELSPQHLGALTAPAWLDATATIFERWTNECTPSFQRTLESIVPESQCLPAAGRDLSVRWDDKLAMSTRLPIILAAIAQQWPTLRTQTQALRAPMPANVAFQWFAQLFPAADTLAALRARSIVPIYTYDAPPAQAIAQLWIVGATDMALTPQAPDFFGYTTRPPATRRDAQLTLAFPLRQHAQEQLAWRTQQWRARAATIHVCAPQYGFDGRELEPSELWFDADAEPAWLARRHFPAAVPIDATARAAHEHALQNALHVETPPPLLVADDVRTALQQRYASAELSASELERFAACPFAFFAEQLLGLNDTPDPTPDLLPQTRGAWRHQILAELYTTHLDDIRALIGKPAAQQHAAIDQLLTQLSARIAPPSRRQHTPDPALRPAQHAHLLRELRQCVLIDVALWQQDANQTLRPAHCEWRFGSDTAAPIVLTTADGPVALRGTIDRIDIDPATSELLIYDYKSGQTDAVIKNITDGTHLQLPLYLLAIAQAMPEWRAMGALLIGLRHGERKHGLIDKIAGSTRLNIGKTTGSMKDAEAIAALLDTAREFIGHYAAQLRRGDIPLVPHTCDSRCNWWGLSRHEGRTS